ncbi:type II toxin-antitoxin system VapC family toxin [Mycobacterium branderi]|uniref:Ribonuclease VapC n=1 Tax=Mycobacterium branderi TaxID=43348 RepID=A0A7I7W536_9MYCO|nr:type II toxin-antitoxin system VapC family toxin [Mycobacterium branderi]MCV7236048.1 type II toxin-antitoxin system VapC family toxin [Mycobacterium branderi]ORA32769.1 VapC toxin family PIN domain ribonuclease [Mycobacterium branderi]BBZ12107.1 ribonuclease VapC [Mycobacterium branderi]
MAATYLDSSAVVKLAVREPESDALRRYLRSHRPWVSSALTRTEVMRAVLDKGEPARKAGRRALADLDLIRVDNRVLDLAGALLPSELRSLDAIHMATAQRLGNDLREVVTYDVRMTEAAELLGFRVMAPT